MIAVYSLEPHMQTGAVISALIIVACAVGLTLDSSFYAGKPRRDFFVYYTNQSNLLVLLYFAFASPLLYTHGSALIAHAEFALTMGILLTFFVFHCVLRPFVLRRLHAMRMTREDRMMIASNVLLHYVVPLLTGLYWLLCSPGKSRLQAADALIWTAFPVLYLIFVFVRAPIRGNIHGTSCPYPYPFVNIQRLGLKSVLRSCAVLYAVFTLGALMIVRIVQTAYEYCGDGHAFFLV